MRINTKDLENRFYQHFDIKKITIIDESILHQGHNEQSLKETTHLKIIIQSLSVKAKLSLIEKHKLIKNFVYDKIGHIHSISIKILS